jgi:hypothetical protein
MAGDVFRARAVPARTVGIRPDQVRDVLDVRDDAMAALTVLALIARMLRELLADRPDRGYPLSAAAITIGAVKVALPMRCGRLGRGCPLPADAAVVAGYETAVARMLTTLDDIQPPSRARVRPIWPGPRPRTSPTSCTPSASMCAASTSPSWSSTNWN